MSVFTSKCIGFHYVSFRMAFCPEGII
uniref:Uncharacterized protein n=1 Tax=Anguilla anguilla TaxID=7936 RepID=A0A0E9VCM4_ANGAN